MTQAVLFGTKNNESRGRSVLVVKSRVPYSLMGSLKTYALCFIVSCLFLNCFALSLIQRLNQKTEFSSFGSSQVQIKFDYE